MPDIHKILKKVFGHENFRPGQQDIIESVVDGNDTLVFMPTGGGKSLTYQMPALAREGLCVVISPLISLMKDQVDALRELGIKAELINSSISFGEQQNILNEISTGDSAIRFLYIAPERLNSGGFIRVLKNVKISLLAIDEAHCISQWGHDFRPSYMKVKSFIDELQGEQKSFPIMALTATATQKVKADIKVRLGLNTCNMFTTGFDRKNIIIIVREISKKEEKLEKTFEILAKTPGNGIIYCSSRKAVDEVFQFLLENGISAGKYTGAMNPADREQTQNDFMQGNYKVIVATNAFGMGIDKKDIRFVIHYNLPGSIENYYQEVGRAGRDDKNSYGIVLASYQDTKIQEFFIQNTYPSKKEILEVYDYLYSSGEKEILKTYYDIATGSGLNNDMKVGSAIKILEKYGIIRRGVVDMGDSNFRGRGLTLLQEKRPHSHILIDWTHQQKLEDEAYFKLDQIKKLLFYPHCRKRGILEYFGDEGDLEKLQDNCGSCDFCIEAKKFGTGEIKDMVPSSVFGIVLDSIKEYDDTYGVVMFARILTGSNDKRIIEQSLQESDFYGALEDYKRGLVKAVIESLIQGGFIAKSEGQYPIVSLTDLGDKALYKQDLITQKNTELQHYIHMKYKKEESSRSDKNSSLTFSSKGGGKKSATYTETLNLLKKGYSVSSIAEERGIKERTIEDHALKLYESGQLELVGFMKTVEFANIKMVKGILTEHFPNGFERLRDVKEKCDEAGIEVQRSEISACKAMLEKGDL